MIINAQQEVYWLEDFLGNSDSNMLSTVSGTAASTTGTGVVADTAHPGIGCMSMGTDTNGYAYRSWAINSVLLGGGIWKASALVQIPQLSTAGDEFISVFGFFDNLTGGDAVDGVYFEYDRLNSTQWRCCTSSNSSRTKTASGITVSAGAWVYLSFFVNAAASSVSFLINNAVVRTETATIPTGSGRETGLAIGCRKSAGTTDLTGIACDFAETFHRLTNPRWAI